MKTKLFTLLLAMVTSTGMMVARQVVFDFSSKEALQSLGISVPEPNPRPTQGFAGPNLSDMSLEKDGIIISGEKHQSVDSRIWCRPITTIIDGDTIFEYAYELRIYKPNILTFSSNETITSVLFEGAINFDEIESQKVWFGNNLCVSFTSASTSQIKQIIITVGEPAEYAKGMCGNNLMWRHTNDSLLTITGYGEMTNYSLDNKAPWYNYEKLVKYVSFSDDQTSIGNYSLYGCSSLNSITIPNNITSVGNFAFTGCIGITTPLYNAHVFAYLPTIHSGSYSVPEGIELIAGGAFYGCQGLTSITLPNSLTNIGDDAFSGCTGLPIIDNIRYADTYLVEVIDKTKTTYSIKEGTKWIDKNAFSECYALEAIYVPCGEIEKYRQMLPSIATKVQYEPSPYTVTSNASNGDVNISNYTICDENILISATANYGYHFAQWSDGNTDNPRTIELTQDTTFTAEFAKNTYTISTTSANPEWGTTTGNKSALYLDEVEISATPNYGYHFVQWSDREYICDDWWDGVCYWGHWGDYNTEPTRTIVVERDSIFTATFAKNVYSIAKIAEHGYISGNSSAEYLDEVTLSVSSDYGYHFAQWSDGNTDNPRTIVLTQDTTFTAEFAKNTYTISTTSANPEWGTTAGGKSALYLDEVEISATPNYGYHFVQWSDGNTSNPRTISVTEDKTFTATFAKNVYSITKNAEHGSISGNNSAEYLDFVTLTVTPDYGYHFVQWSDGLKDNPRIFQITSDTTFTAEFAYDRVGTCGKDLALVWSYDPANKVLTIGNAGEFTENMQFGVEAPNEMEELVIGNNVTAIGENAFAGISTLKKVTIGESVKTIYDRAFYNCVNLETIFNYRPTPTNTYSTAFDGVDKFECILYVLPNSIDMYKNASVWRDFYYTYAIGATATTVNEVSVTPAVNTAAVAWPAVENAFTYELVIKDKSGNIVCTLVFNANGQLTAIAFAAPGRAQASTQATGFSFTVTGLDSGTGYDLTINAKDDQGQVISTTTQSFTTATDTTTGIDATTDTISVRKQIINGQLFILRDGKTYTVQGQEVK